MAYKLFKKGVDLKYYYDHIKTLITHNDVEIDDKVNIAYYLFKKIAYDHTKSLITSLKNSCI